MEYDVSLKDALMLMGHGKKDMTHIQFKRGHFFVRKSVKGKTVIFGKFKCYDDAVKVRDWMVKNKWNRLLLTKACRELGVEDLNKR